MKTKSLDGYRGAPIARGLVRFSLALSAALSLLLSALLPAFAVEVCYWRGTSPVCDGACNPGERQIRRSDGHDGAPNCGFHDANIRIAGCFGTKCITGTKRLCCKPEQPKAENAPPKAENAPPPIPTCAANKVWSDSAKACVFKEFKQMGRKNTVCAKNDVDIYNSPVEPRNVIGTMNGGTKGTIAERHPDGWYKIQGYGWIANDHFGPCP